MSLNKLPFACIIARPQFDLHAVVKVAQAGLEHNPAQWVDTQSALSELDKYLHTLYRFHPLNVSTKLPEHYYRHAVYTALIVDDWERLAQGTNALNMPFYWFNSKNDALAIVVATGSVLQWREACARGFDAPRDAFAAERITL